MTFDTTTIGIIAAVLAVLILGFLIMRPKKAAPRVERREGEPYIASTERPYMKAKDGTEGNSLADEIAAASTDVAGEVLGVEAHNVLAGATRGAVDDLGKLKGVGPKFVARLHELGITSYAQLAGFNETELAHLDERLGPFKGRLARDRVAEQADYLARGDVDGFEEKFGKLGG